MQLDPGSTLGSYEIVAPLGAGGMGEVYRARDARLEREVAIKVLPEGFSENEERVARFEREAKALAALNHPNVATIFGFEQEGDRHFLVMELVEGEDLAERIARGPVPVEEAIPLFLQIAEGLEAAHERGIVHRDLKPANVKIGVDGRVKILDFGLARAMEPSGASGDPDLTQSPTMTAAATMRGEILGTAAYMAPEQASGRAVDKRADIWAFGCCLYEALTAERPFAGADFPEILASILRDEPELAALPEEAPAAVRRILGRCLEKSPRERFRDIGDVRFELAHAGDAPVEEARAASGATRAGRWPWLGAGLAVGSLVTLAFTLLGGGNEPPDAAPGPSLRTEIVVPETASLSLGIIQGFDPVRLALSPDGTQLVFVGQQGAESWLYHRDLSAFGEPSRIPGSEGATFAVFSPDGRSIGFLANDAKVRRMSLDGDDLRVLCDFRNAQRVLWAEDGWIYFGDDEGVRSCDACATPAVTSRISSCLPERSETCFRAVAPSS